MSVAASPLNFQTFISNNKPVYEGTYHDGREVKVILSSWNTKGNFGYGEIYPFEIPSSYHEASHRGCFEFRNNVIYFTEDNYGEAIVLALRVSDRFSTLTIIDRLSQEILGTLKRLGLERSRA